MKYVMYEDSVNISSVSAGINLGFPGGSDGKESACNAGAQIWSLGQEDPPGEGNGNPLQYSCLENPMDGRAWWATVLGLQRVQHD